MLLLQGDCLEVMKTLPDKSVDLFLCDLPYGCLTGGGGQEKRRRRFQNGVDTGTIIKQTEGVIAGCAWDIKIDLAQFWVQVKRLMKDDHTPIIHFCSTKFGFDLYNSNPDWFRYDLVWNKMRGVSFLSANKMPMRSHEMIYVFAKKGARYYRTDIVGKFDVKPAGRDEDTSGFAVHRPASGTWIRNHNDGTHRCVLSVVEMPSDKKRGKHPTQKPDDLYAWLMERYSKEGDTVLDPTAGSFASVFTAERMGRIGIGIEMNEEFYAKAVEKNTKKE
jgi:site-specific DNA-methyltransferase (adenine-specific)